MRDDQLRFAVVVFLRVVERVEKGLHVLAVDFLGIESVSLEPRGGVFALRRSCWSVECDGVGIVNQDEIIETEMAGERARLRGNAFLQTTVPRETNAVLVENAMLARVKACGRHFHRDGDSNRVAHALAEWAGRAFDSRCFEKFRMTWCF